MNPYSRIASLTYLPAIAAWTLHLAFVPKKKVKYSNYIIETLVLRPSKFHKKNSTKGCEKQVKLSQDKLFEMHCFTMFITALCVIFLKYNKNYRLL